MKDQLENLKLEREITLLHGIISPLNTYLMVWYHSLVLSFWLGASTAVTMALNVKLLPQYADVAILPFTSSPTTLTMNSYFRLRQMKGELDGTYTCVLSSGQSTIRYGDT
jgi:hypothetical protein